MDLTSSSLSTSSPPTTTPGFTQEKPLSPPPLLLYTLDLTSSSLSTSSSSSSPTTTPGFTQEKPLRQSWLDWLLGKEPVMPEVGALVEDQTPGDAAQEPGGAVGARNARQVC